MPFIYDPLKFVGKYDPVNNPVETPGIDAPDQEPTRCIRISEKLIPYLLGLIERYVWVDAWRGTPEEIAQAIGVFQDLRIILTEGNCLPPDCPECPECPPPSDDCGCCDDDDAPPVGEDCGCCDEDDPENPNPPADDCGCCDE